MTPCCRRFHFPTDDDEGDVTTEGSGVNYRRGTIDN